MLPPALISYTLAVIHLTMTLLTNMPLGVIKIIPMKLHSIVELVGPVLIIGTLALPNLVTGGRWLSALASLPSRFGCYRTILATEIDDQ